MNYLIIYDSTQLQFDQNHIHRFITTSTEISDWWHYIQNLYIITTDISAKTMADSIISTYPGLRFFISRIDLNDYNGVLHTSAWDWIKRKTGQLLNLKPAPRARPTTIQDLLSRINQNQGTESLVSKTLRQLSEKY